MKWFIVDTIGGNTILVKATNEEKARKKALQAIGKHTGNAREAGEEEIEYGRRFWKITEEEG